MFWELKGASVPQPPRPGTPAPRWDPPGRQTKIIWEILQALSLCWKQSIHVST